ncbi:MAG TPA: NnrU family protein [Burkholderiales bacterium]
MDATALLALGTAAFLLTHFVSSTPLRAALISAIGEWPYRGVYSLLAVVTLGWMIWAYAQAPQGALLWTPLRLLPLIAMPFSLILIVCGYWRNPSMVGAEKLLKSEEPARGMIRITRHPLMWGIMLWAGAHILARADLKSILFFGGFLVLAALGTVLMDLRKRDNPDFQRFAAVTSHVPFVAIAQGRNRLVWSEIGWLRPGIGVVAYAAFLVLHPWLFGARPY